MPTLGSDNNLIESNGTFFLAYTLETVATGRLQMPLGVANLVPKLPKVRLPLPPGIPNPGNLVDRLLPSPRVLDVATEAKTVWVAWLGATVRNTVETYPVLDPKTSGLHLGSSNVLRFPPVPIDNKGRFIRLAIGVYVYFSGQFDASV